MLSLPGYRLIAPPSLGPGKLTEITVEILAEGLKAGTKALLFPGSHTVQIKSLRRLGKNYCLAVKGLARSSLKVGAVLVSSDWPVREAREGLFLMAGTKIPNKTLVQGGIAPDFNREHLIGKASFHQEGSYLSVRFPSAFPLLPGARYTLWDDRGTPRHLTLLWAGSVSSSQQRQLEALVRRRPNPHPEPKEIYGRLLHVVGYAAIPPFLISQKWAEAEVVGHWVILKKRRAVLEKLLIKKISQPGGVEKKRLALRDFPDALVQEQAAGMLEKETLVDRQGWYFPPGDALLSPFLRGLLEKIHATGQSGFSVRSLKDSSQREACEVLARAGLLFGGEQFWFSADVFDEISKHFLAGKVSGDRITIAEVRKCWGGSRVLSLEILQAMEKGRLLNPDKEGKGERRVC